MGLSPSTSTSATTRPIIRPRRNGCFRRFAMRSGRSAPSSRRSIEEGWMPEDTGNHDLAPGVLTEYLDEDSGIFVRSAHQFERFRSPYQSVEVHDTRPFGKLFRLDGHFMTSEKDEFFYHENLVHMAALSHPRPQRALVVGGGDGGSAEELLNHPSIERVTLAEIDASVVDISRKHWANVQRGSLDDPRVDLRIEDGFAYVRNARERFDLIVLDL